MTNYLRPTFYNNRGKHTQWINNICNSHDLLCGCETPIKHLILTIAEREEKIEVTTEEKRNILKCLSTTEDLTTKTGEDGDIDEIGLDAIFAEDMDDGTG